MITKLRNKAGLSLVELIVAIAIFAIAGIAICGFVSFSTKNFANSNKNVKLQYEEQLTVERVKDIILETSRGIAFDKSTSTLKVFSDNPDFDASAYKEGKASGDAAKPYLITAIRLSEDKNATASGKYKFELAQSCFAEGVTLDTVAFADSAFATLADTVTKFEVDLSDLKSENQVMLNMTFKSGDKEITVNQVITLRNKISEVTKDTDLDDLYDGEVVEIYSPVKKIEISRDGNVFAQSKVDTIKMAGTQTSADYDATVTMKSGYTGDFDSSVKWSIALESVKEGYENYISINESTGVVTVKSGTDSNGNTILPTEYMSGDYFVITATSNQDPTKSAKLRIKVETGGVYPVSIEYAGQTLTVDTVNLVATYKFTQSITYTANIEDPATGVMVNPLTGDGAYTKVKYYMASDSAAVPSGAGFTATTAVNGEFLVTKSMEGKTYHIICEVLQKNVNGEAVTCDIYLEVPEGIIPSESLKATVPQLSVSDSGIRGTINSMSASWSDGVPTYTDGNNNSKTYSYLYEWEITDNGNECGNWGSGDRDSFDNLVFLTDGNSEWSSNYGKTYETSQSKRILQIYVRSYLDWNKTFTIKANLRVKLYKDGNTGSAQYYTIPTTTDPSESDYLTSDKSSAYVASQVITISPVTLTLAPAEGVVFYNQDQKQQGALNSVFSTSLAVGKGKNPSLTTDWNKQQQGYEYYKIFKPTFTGLSFTIFNYTSNVKGILETIGGKSALQTYTLENGKYVYNTSLSTSQWTGDGKDWACGIKKDDTLNGSIPYFYLKMIPINWTNTTGQLPIGARWDCVVYDSYGNQVYAKFTQMDNASFINYKIYEAWEGEYTYTP